MHIHTDNEYSIILLFKISDKPAPDGNKLIYELKQRITSR